MSALTLVMSRPALVSRHSAHEAEDLLDIASWMREENGGDGGFFGSSTIKRQNLPFPGAPLRRSTLPFPSAPRQSKTPSPSAPRSQSPFPPRAPANSSSSRSHPTTASSSFPSSTLSHPAHQFDTSTLAERRAHRRALSSPDSVVSLALSLSVSTSSPSSSDAKSAASPTAPTFHLPIIPQAQHLAHHRSLRKHQRSRVRASAVPFAVFSATRCETPPVPTRDLAATAVLLRQAEVKLATNKRKGGEPRAASTAGKEGGAEEGELLRINGVEFELCPIVVVQRGYAI